MTGEGLGPVKIGMSRAEAEKALGKKLRLQSADPSTLSECANASSPDRNASYMFQKFRVVRVDVGKKGITTPEGLGVGSPEDALRSAYGARARFTAHPYGNGNGPNDWHYVSIHLSAERDLLFETDGKRVTSFRVGLPQAVSLIEGCS